MKISKRPLPKEVEGVEFANVVHVPEEMLKTIATTVDRDTGRLSDLLLRKLVPLMLSYETSTNYARAAMKEGLNVEIDFDKGLSECVNYVGYLNVVMHFIKSSALPRQVKQRFMNHFSDKLAEQTVAALVDANKVQSKQTLMQELQAVVYSRKDNKSTVHTNTRESEDEQQQEKRAPRQLNPTAVRRRRST
jgi:transcription antitermination factor NusG